MITNHRHDHVRCFAKSVTGVMSLKLRPHLSKSEKILLDMTVIILI